MASVQLTKWEGLLAAAIAAAVALISTYAVPGDIGNDILIAGIAVAALAPLLVRFWRRAFDIFEPLVLVAFAFLLLWVARPSYNLIEHQDTFGFHLWSQYHAALLAAYVSICSLQIAYHSALPLRLAASLPAPRDDVPRRTLLVAAVALTLAAALSIAVIAHVEGGFHRLFARYTVVTDVPPFVLESFLVALPAAVLFLCVPSTGRTRAIRWLALVPLGLIGVMAIPGGHRRDMLPVAVALVTLPFLWRDRRPPLALVVALVAAVLVLVVDPLRTVRTRAESYPTAVMKTLERPYTPATSLLRADDTAMIDAVAMQIAVTGKIHLVIPSVVGPETHHVTGWQGAVPFRYGLEFLSDTVLAPVPRQVWPGKPLKTQTILIDHFFGTTPSGGCLTKCPTFSFVGESYADFGLWSVAILSAVFGVGLATGYSFLLRYRRNRLAQAAYASGLWLAFVPWEAGMVMIMHSFILTVGPVLLVAWATGRRATATADESARSATARLDAVPADPAFDVLESETS